MLHQLSGGSSEFAVYPVAVVIQPEIFKPGIGIGQQAQLLALLLTAKLL